MKLPELPEPVANVQVYRTKQQEFGLVDRQYEPAFTTNQLREFALQYGEAVREECAKKVEGGRDDWMRVKWPDRLDDFGRRLFASIAAAIRAKD